MQIIPVIDIRMGKVVHARGGCRARYPELESVLTRSSSPAQVLADLLAWHIFPVVYIADLDAIESGQVELARYTALLQRFPELDIWLDTGIRTRSDYARVAGLPRLHPVLGSETLMETDLLQARCVLSLDRRQGQVLGEPSLPGKPAGWPENVIAMDLDAVGAAHGPDYGWLSRLRSARADVALYAAGGIRDMADLRRLQQMGLSGVLLASALHDGRLSRMDILAMMKQERRPR